MDKLEKFIETSLGKKEDFYSNLKMENIADLHHNHGKTVCKDFEIKNLGECHDFYLKSNTLLLVDVFKISRKICLEIYKLDPAKFLSAPGLAWQTAFKEE